MADDKHLTDGDRIKELLAQLRATMDLEEETSETETEQAPQEDGYAIALEELLSIEGEDEAESSAEEAPQEDEEAPVETDEVADVEEKNEEADELPEHEPDEKEEATETSVSDILSSFFTIDEKDRHGQVSIADSFLDVGAEESDSFEEEERVEEDAFALADAHDEPLAEETKEEEQGEEKEEEAELLFRPDDDVSLTFEEKIDVVSPSALSLPANEDWDEEEETADVVLEGGFVAPSKEEEREEEESPLVSLLPGGKLSFSTRVSLPSWGEETEENTEEIEKAEETEEVPFAIETEEAPAEETTEE